MFVDPAQQGRGIGNSLLERTLEHARKSGAAHKALITFTFNRVSQGLYMRHGFFPRTPIYFFDARREAVRMLPEAVLRAVPIEPDAATMETLATVDRCAIGVSRDKHHRYLLGDLATRGFLFYAGSDPAGYGYIGANGHIGPLAVLWPDNVQDAFAAALRLAAAGTSERISAFLPGACDGALSLAVNQGMRITFPMLLMASPGYGDWTRYLPRNPGFM